MLVLFQTNLELVHINTYQDKLLRNTDEMHKQLFLAKVLNPKKIMHYTGMENGKLYPII